MDQVQTKVINRQNRLLLVEWTDGATHRAWVTPDMVVDDTGRVATIEHPQGGIPYGVDWSALLSGTISADEIKTRLYGSGIWTVEDLQAQPKVALGVIQAVAGNVLQELLTNARAYQKEARIQE